MLVTAEPGQTLTSEDLSSQVTLGWRKAHGLLQAAEETGPALRVNLDQPLPSAIEEIERAFVDRAMAACGGRVHEAAQLLGISRKGLFLKRRRWGLVDDADE